MFTVVIIGLENYFASLGIHIHLMNMFPIGSKIILQIYLRLSASLQILVQYALTYVSKGTINNKPALTWVWTGDKTQYEAMMV